MKHAGGLHQSSDCIQIFRKYFSSQGSQLASGLLTFPNTIHSIAFFNKLWVMI
jgi:hypothetical protein